MHLSATDSIILGLKIIQRYRLLYICNDKRSSLCDFNDCKHELPLYRQLFL